MQGGLYDIRFKRFYGMAIHWFITLGIYWFGAARNAHAIGSQNCRAIQRITQTVKILIFMIYFGIYRLAKGYFIDLNVLRTLEWHEENTVTLANKVYIS